MPNDPCRESEGQSRRSAGTEKRRRAAGAGQRRRPRLETARRAALLRYAAGRAQQRLSAAAPESAGTLDGQNVRLAPDVEQLRARLQRVRAEILAAPRRFLEQGAVVSNWRTRNGRRFGPYFHLVYREGGRQHTLYLGTSEALAQAVRDLLDNLREPLRSDRQMRRQRKHAIGLLRDDLSRLEDHLAARGAEMPPWEVRGVRRVIRSLRSVARPRSRKTCPRAGNGF